MSERKTTEIKLRVTPAEKNSWQLAAEDEGIGLSELIRREMNGVAQKPSASLNAVPGDAWRYEFPVVVSDSVPPGYVAIKNLTDAQSSDAEGEDSSIEQAVPTSDAESRVAKPWMFEARSSE